MIAVKSLRVIHKQQTIRTDELCCQCGDETNFKRRYVIYVIVINKPILPSITGGHMPLNEEFDSTPEIGRRLQQFLERKQIDRKKLLELCDEEREKHPDDKYKVLEDLDIRNIQDGIFSVRHSYNKLELISKALKVFPDWLTGRMNHRLVDTGSLEDVVYSDEVTNLLAEGSKGVDCFIAWSEFFPCSLETIKFMDMHNKALALGGNLVKRKKYCTPEERRLMHERYTKIGCRRKQSLEDSAGTRPFDFFQLMLLKDIENIAYGKEEYSDIPPIVRKECFEEVIRILKDQARYRVYLVVANGDERGLPNFGAYDSVLGYSYKEIPDKKFVFRRFRESWQGEYSTHTAIRYDFINLKEFHKLAYYDSQDNSQEVVDLLTDICQKIEI